MFQQREDYWQLCGKPQFIQETIKEICENIAKRGSKTHYDDVFANLYEYIEENIEKFLPDQNDDYIEETI